MPVALTDLAIERMRPPKDARVELGDAVVRGLSLRVTPSGVKSWSVIYKVPGEGGVSRRGGSLKGTQHRITLGPWPALRVNGLNGMIEHAGITPLKKRLYSWLDRNTGPAGPVAPELPDDAFCINGANDADALTRMHALIGNRLPDQVFLQPNSLVRARVLTKREDDLQGIVRHPGSVEVARVEKHWLAVSLSAAGARFFKRGQKADIEVPASAASYEQLLALPELAPFDELRGISRVPTITRDAPGYDPESKMLLHFGVNDFPSQHSAGTKYIVQALRWSR